MKALRTARKTSGLTQLEVAAQLGTCLARAKLLPPEAESHGRKIFVHDFNCSQIFCANMICLPRDPRD